MTIPGVPEGYKAVRWGVVNAGESYLVREGGVYTGPSSNPAQYHLIVELINKPIEAGEGYRLIDNRFDEPQAGDEFWSLASCEWVLRAESDQPFHSAVNYRRRIQKTEKITFYTAKVTFYEVVDTSRFHTYRELIWVDRVCDEHTPTGNRIEIEVPVKA